MTRHDVARRTRRLPKRRLRRPSEAKPPRARPSRPRRRRAAPTARKHRRCACSCSPVVTEEFDEVIGREVVVCVVQRRRRRVRVRGCAGARVLRKKCAQKEVCIVCSCAHESAWGPSTRRRACRGQKEVWRGRRRRVVARRVARGASCMIARLRVTWHSHGIHMAFTWHSHDIHINTALT